VSRSLCVDLPLGKSPPQLRPFDLVWHRRRPYGYRCVTRVFANGCATLVGDYGIREDIGLDLDHGDVAHCVPPEHMQADRLFWVRRRLLAELSREAREGGGA